MSRCFAFYLLEKIKNIKIKKNKIKYKYKIMVNRKEWLNKILHILNRNGRYTALNNGSKSINENGIEYIEMEKKSRDRALSICQDYIDKTPRFVLVKQLNNIGEPLPITFFFKSMAAE